ncbi:MAG: TonB-dependent receptor domain-containing protein [bacterium]
MKRVQPGMAAAVLLCNVMLLFLHARMIKAAEVQGRQSGRWTVAASPYIVTGNIIIPEDQQLIIEPGVVVKFAGDFSLTVDGSLKAFATTGNRIVFTSIRDKDFFAMVSPTTLQPGSDDWSGIVFSEKSFPAKNSLVNVTIRYSKSPISANLSNPLLQNIIIENCAANVVLVNGKIYSIQQGTARDYSESVAQLLSGEFANKNVSPTRSDITVVAPPPTDATLRGKVFDGESAEVLPAVNIQVISKNNAEMRFGTASGATGEFEIKNLAPDEYEIRISYISYEEKIITEFLRAGEVKNLNVGMNYTGILFNPITVTASRRPEAFLDAPAAISVLEKEEISARGSLNPADHLKGMPAVDVASTGLNAAISVVRGFNNVFSGTLLSLVDNRISRAPSLRVNSYQFIPNASEDYDRVEIVLGPGSALYGPNSANGVMHILTKSPFESPGTTVSIGGGERSIYEASFRHAGILNDRFAYKISGQFYQGEDWQYVDDEEARAKQTAIAAGADPALLKIGARDFDVERIAGDARVDFQINDDAMLTVNAGLTQASNIELTGIGASQLVDWLYFYGQTRLRYKDLSAQVFVNQSDAGDTYLLRTGNPIVDKSQLFVGQLQHTMSLNPRQRFVYGLDALLTRPQTGGTVNGKNESSDNINEIGLYVQSETDFSSRLKLVAAGRIDDHNHIQDPVFSPRLAFILKPRPTHSVRLTFNRAFSTPTSNNLFLDIMQERTANPLPAPLRAALGLNDDIANVRVLGVPSENGLTFQHGQDGRAQMYSQFDLVEGYSDANINTVWPKIRTVLVAANAQLDALLPDLLSQNVPLVYINPATGQLMGNPVDVPPIRETVTNTFEIGYKGLLSEKLTVGADIYRTHIEDFVSPLLVTTPTAHALQTIVGPVLEQDIYNRLIVVGTPDQVARATAQGVVAGIYDPNSSLYLEAIPLGVASPEQVRNDVSVIATYRNFGNVWMTGADLRFTYLLNANFSLNANYSYVNHDLFKNLDGISDIALNAPRNKFNAGMRYQNTQSGMFGLLRLRHVAGFPVNSGTYIGTIRPYTLLDFAFSYSILQNTILNLTIQNLLNNMHREMVGAPNMGRLATLRLRHSF